MRPRSLTRRRVVNNVVMVLSGLAASVGIIFLAWILWEVLARGASALGWTFLTNLPTPPGVRGGGVANAIYGTVVMTALATVMGMPLGLLAGVFMAEFGKGSRFAAAVRFMSNVLMGTPSIIIGVFVYTIIVIPTRNFSGYAGAVALGVIMLPVVARTTEDMLNLVPNSLRESALALGAPHWRTTLNVVFRAAKAGLLTGTLLAVARVSGETAPLLFTALNSPYWPVSLAAPTANLPVTIFNFAMSPFVDWQRMAWGASFLITAGVLLLTVIARLSLQRERKT